MGDNNSSVSGTTVSIGSLPAPLIHEVNALLEKERTLMELKLLEQEVQAAKWKGKYDDLKEKIIESKAVEPQDTMKLEKLAEVDEDLDEDPAARLGPKQHNNLSALLLRHIKGNLGDFNFIPLTKQLFSAILKAALGLRSQYPAVDTLWFHGCGITKESVEAIEYMLRSPRLQGLDMSRNELDDDSLFSFVEILNSKKKTPQFLLLHGINGWAHSNRAYLEILQALSKETWGLSISLADTVDNARETIQKSINAGKRKGEIEGDLLYKDFKQPYRIARFIQALRMRIEESNKTGDGNEGLDNHNKQAQKLANAKLNKKKLTNVPMIGRFGKVVPRLADTLKELSVFGLTEYPLSNFALKELELLMYTVQSTLTDLDLSFSYIGVHGAVILEAFLKDRQCQLVALRLKGNLLGDPGCTRIGLSLQANKTVTYLDMSSNCISWTGLEAIRDVLLQSRTLVHLDLTQNEILRSDAEELDDALRDISSTLFVKWYKTSEPEVIWRIPKKCPIMYDRPSMASKLCGLGHRVLLARFNLTELYFHHPHEQRRPLVLRWAMRPAPQRSYEEVQREMALRRKPLDLQNIEEEPYTLLNIFTCVGWEVSVNHNRHEYFHATDDISEEFHTRDLFCEGQRWDANSVVIKDPPTKGQVEIYGYLRMKRTHDQRGRPIVFHPARQFMRIEWKDVVVHPLYLSSCRPGDSGHGWFHLGGDAVDQSPRAIQDLHLEQYAHYSTLALLKEHFLLRGLAWKFPMKVVKIVFEAKLCVLPERPLDDAEALSRQEKDAIEAMFADDENDDDLEASDLYDHDLGGKPHQRAAGVDANRLYLDRHGRPKHTAGNIFDYDCFLTIHRRYEDPEIIRQFRGSQEVIRRQLWMKRQQRLRRRLKRAAVSQPSGQLAAAAADDEHAAVAAHGSRKEWPVQPTLQQLEAGEAEDIGDAHDDVTYDWYRKQYHGFSDHKHNGHGDDDDEYDPMDDDEDGDRDLYGATGDKEDEIDGGVGEDDGDKLAAADRELQMLLQHTDPNPLVAWKWQRFVVYATDLRRTDTLFLTGQPCIHTSLSPEDGSHHGTSRDARKKHQQSFLSAAQKKLLSQIAVVARNVQVYTYMGDTQHYDRHAYAEMTPLLFRPEDVFAPLLHYTLVDEDGEQQKQTDRWRHMFDAYGVDVEKFHSSQLAEVLDCPDISIPEDEMKAFQERAFAACEAGKLALQQAVKANEDEH